MGSDAKAPSPPGPGAGWSNWSGSLRFNPSQINHPKNEDEVVRLVRFAAETGRTIRPIGSGHSSTGLVETDDILLCTDRLSGVVSADPARREITLRPGTTLHEAGKRMLELGLAPPNLGDIDMQTVAGTIGTGTHGTGRRFRNLSDMLTGGRLVTGSGTVREFTAGGDRQLTRALRVSLGALGIFTELKLAVLPAYRLRRQEWCSDVEHCLGNWHELTAGNRNFDFYWYPRTDEMKIRILNEPGQGMTDLSWARCIEDRTDWAAAVIPKHSGLSNRFDEMEYALPIDAAIECFRELRQRVRERHRRNVAWRVLVRTIAADDLYLSPASGRDCVSISVHQNAGLPFWRYFLDVEPIFRAYEGRPHWAKKHRLAAADLAPLYPGWSDFLKVRRELDPENVFLTPYLAEIFGEEPAG